MNLDALAKEQALLVDQATTRMQIIAHDDTLHPQQKTSDMNDIRLELKKKTAELFARAHAVPSTDPVREEIKRRIWDKLDKQDDPINHPKHYNSHPSGVECITIARHMGFNLGNALKYIWRAGLKGTTTKQQDLEKAIFYLRDELENMNNV